MAIGVVTYKRPRGLATLLEHLGAQVQTLPDGTRASVVVVDNSPGLEARAVVEAFRIDHGLPVSYIPHGGVNIAEGRNELLQRMLPEAPVLAFIDDDEVPRQGWLAALVAALQRHGADIVVGPVWADYPDGAPAWLQRPLFHSVPGEQPAGWTSEGWTGNYALRAELVRRHALRFDESLGRSGGEDQLFFRQAIACGARMYYEPSAAADETVPPERLAVRYLLRREHRKGITLGLLDRSRPGWPAGRPLRRALQAAYWTAGGLLVAARGAASGEKGIAVGGLMRAVRGVGMVAGLLGRNVVIYGGGDARPTSTPTVAFVASEGPDHQQAGHSRYLEGFLSHFRSRGFRVVVLVTTHQLGFLVRRSSGTGLHYRAPGLAHLGDWEVVVSPTAVAAHLAWWGFRRLPRWMQQRIDAARSRRRRRAGVDHVLGAWQSPATERWVADHLVDVSPGVVLYNTIFAVPRSFIRSQPDGVHVVICHDVVSERADSMRTSGHLVAPADFSAADEARSLADFDTVVAIQWDDARSLAALAPHAQVVVVPVSMRAHVTDADARVPGRCLFVGSGSLHNVEAIRWFLDHCWPGIRQRMPEAELHVVGTVCARLGDVPQGVVLRGEVADLVAEYRDASVVLAPLRSGSGLKVKVVEAICHGVASVVTSVGAQGLGGLHPRPFIEADEPTAFVDAVADLLGDSTARMVLEEAAREVARLFDPAQAYQALDHALAAAGVGDLPLTGPHGMPEFAGRTSGGEGR
nr:glycosyltransferase [Geodermatophilus nigrescens]